MIGGSDYSLRGLVVREQRTSVHGGTGNPVEPFSWGNYMVVNYYCTDRMAKGMMMSLGLAF